VAAAAAAAAAAAGGEGSEKDGGQVELTDEQKDDLALQVRGGMAMGAGGR